ncbi:PaaI family thioesterase [Rubrivirga sp. IMCC45206]|uniref:PaaI family thioesterase n=1 Tax=Rubrivirga sp. IMCC45206 TaxID=3391614 RepID=UPI00399027D7
MSVPSQSPIDPAALMDAMKAAGADGLRLPPPVLLEMKAEIRDYRPADGVGAALVARFPLLEKFQNPMGLMQGGMLAAAVDNVVGPLSYLVAAPSVTAQLTMTYLAPATPDLGHVEVEARFVARAGRQLVFDATVSAPDGTELALARITNTVLRAQRDAA